MRALLLAECAEIRILSRDEAKQDRMRRAKREPRLRFVIEAREHAALTAALSRY